MRFHEWLPRGSPAGRPLAGASRDRVRIRSRGPPAGVAAALVGPLATLASHLTDRGRPRTNGRGHWTSSSAPPRVASHDSPLRTYLHKYTLSRSSTRVRARHTHTYSQQTRHIQTRTHPYSLTYRQTLIHPCIHLSHTSTGISRHTYEICKLTHVHTHICTPDWPGTPVRREALPAQERRQPAPRGRSPASLLSLSKEVSRARRDRAPRLRGPYASRAENKEYYALRTTLLTLAPKFINNNTYAPTYIPHGIHVYMHICMNT